MTTDLGTSDTVNATQRARAASSVAVAHAASAAHSAALAAQNAANLAQTAAQNAAVIAAHSASGAAQTAASGTTKGVKEVKQGVYTARSWAAPRLDSAADYWTATVAPSVSSALRTTARRVSPTETAASKSSSILAWSALGAAVLAAVAAGAVVVRNRCRTSTVAESEKPADEEILGGSTGTQPAPVNPDGTRSAATQADPKAETPMNGPVSSSGR